MKPDPNIDDYLSKWASLYNENNYDKGLAAYFLNKSHTWGEAAFSSKDKFSKVLEVGAGTGTHIGAVRHKFDEYWITDLNFSMLDQVKATDPTKSNAEGRGVVRTQNENAASLTFPASTFDRLVATHVLEHLEKPHFVLREWSRVVKPGGVISLVLPCDPGFAWRLGRNFGPREKFTRAGIDYDYWMAREHVNSISNLVSFIRYYFDDRKESWHPLMLPSIDLNLFYVAHVRVNKSE